MRVLVVSGSRARLPDPVYPLGAAMVGTALRRAGHAVEWFDALRHDDAATSLAERLEQLSPDAVMLSIRNIDNAAFPGVHRHFEEHLELARAVVDRGGAPLVLGGSGFSLMPEAFLAYLDADFGVVGEGERAAVELVEQLEAGRRPPRLLRPERLQSPFLAADRDLFDAEWYYGRGGTANVQTQRGCRHRCIYCTYPLLEGHRVRRSDPGPVVDEMERIVAGGIRHIFVVDAVLNSPEIHLAEICEEILRRELEVSFTGYFAPVGELAELPDLLRRAGCEAVELGTDSLSDPVLERMRKGFTAGQAIDYSRRLRASGIKQCHNLIFGAPGESEETMDESVRRMDEIEPTALIATIGLRVYPGTDLVRIAGEADEEGGDPISPLEPRFYLSADVAETVVDRVAAWVDERPGWICPGLGKRYNPRYLERLRRRHKGVLWAMFGD